jgi:MFS family permease
MNAASVPGILVFGHLSDRIPLRGVVLLSALGSATACLLLWGFATQLSVLITFAIAFGFLGQSFSGVWSALITVVASALLVLCAEFSD